MSLMLTLHYRMTFTWANWNFALRNPTINDTDPVQGTSSQERGPKTRKTREVRRYELAQALLLKSLPVHLQTSCSTAIPHSLYFVILFFLSRRPVKNAGMKKGASSCKGRKRGLMRQSEENGETADDGDGERKKRRMQDVQSHSRSCSECKSHASLPALYANARSLMRESIEEQERKRERKREGSLRNTGCDSDHRETSLVASANQRKDSRSASR